jgi:hypothetical protein
MAEKVKSIATQKQELIVELKKLREIKKPSKAERLRKKVIQTKIAEMNKQKLASVRKRSEARKAAALDPEPGISVDSSNASSGTQAPSPAALKYASEQAKQRADKAAAKAAAQADEAERARENREAAYRSAPRKPQTPKQKEAASNKSFDTVPKRELPKAKSKDTLGMAAKEGKAAQEKREAAKRKRDLLSVDPAISKINPTESPPGFTAEPEVASKASNNKKSKGDKKSDNNAGNNSTQVKGLDPITAAMEKFFGTNRTAQEIRDQMDITEKLDARDRGGMKRGGKVKKTKSKPTKKYAMNRGGKVTSVRKPTRA